MTATPGPSGLLKVHGSSKLAFGATTAALVTLASGGSALLVSHVTNGVTSPTSLPPGPLAPDPLGLNGADGLVVDHVAGTPAPQVDPTEKALHDALAARREPGRRTLTAPLIPVQTPPVRSPLIGPPLPVETPPLVPVLTPPAAEHSFTPVAQRTEATPRGRARGHVDKGRHAH